MTETHPEFVAQGSFEHLKLGRKPRREDARTLQLARYLDDSVVLPEIPAVQDWTTGIDAWPMYGNDRLGDCTVAAVGHLIQGWSQAAGGMKVFDEGDVEAMYWETGSPPASSGDAGAQTDDGRDEMSVLNYWRNTGLGQPAYLDRIVAYAAVDPSNLDHVRAAIYIFGGVYTGISLPLTAQGQSVWDVAPDAPGRNQPGSWGGHAVPYLAYDASGFVCVTWGSTLRLTAAFHAEYTEEVYAIVSPDFVGARGASPAGFDLELLEADLAEITRP